MKIAIASDYAGFEYKTTLITELTAAGHEVHNLGTDASVRDDYPDYAAAIAPLILNKKVERGILICGSGVGISIAANKFKGIRAGVCHDTYSAHQSVEHDDMNILCLGQRVIGDELAREIVLTFLKAQYTHETRHQQRLDKLFAIENDNFKEK